MSKLFKPLVLFIIATMIILGISIGVIATNVADYIKNNVVEVTQLPEGYKLKKFDYDNPADIQYQYKSKDGGYITLSYQPGSETSLKQYLESQGVNAPYTTIISTNQGMWCMYIYSHDKEHIGVIDTSDGLIVVSSSLGSYDLSEVIRSIQITSRHT